MPTAMSSELSIREHAPIPTWFGVGGLADRLAAPNSVDQLVDCLKLDPNLRLLGDGANLLVADAGVRELVVSLAQGDFQKVDIAAAPPPSSGIVTRDSTLAVIVHAGAGVNLPRLITDTVRDGLGGLENLAGIPASIGGACAMNAGGTFGQFGDYVHAVHVVDRAGQRLRLARNQVEFAYRHTDLGRRGPGGTGLIVTSVELKLKKSDPAALRTKLKTVMAAKAATQPMSERSAGCAFKNPTLMDNVRDIGTIGTRVSAGMLIDRAGCKGLAVGGAIVSDRHANFIVARPGCTADDILALMRKVRQAVEDKFSVRLEPEVAIWGATL